MSGHVPDAGTQSPCPWDITVDIQVIRAMRKNKAG